MKRLISLLTVIVCVCLSIHAADTASQARKILDTASNKLNLNKGVSANFTVSGGKLNKQAGTIAIKGNKFNVRTANTIVWYDGKTQWLYNKNNNEVNVSTPTKAQQQSMNPYTFVTLYKQGYQLSMDKTAAKEYNIHLVGKGKSINELYILVDKNYVIKSVKMKQNNQWITISISGFKAQTFSDAAFRFNSKDYPKAEVIDLR